jgi:predicted neuraminidase
MMCLEKATMWSAALLRRFERCMGANRSAAALAHSKTWRRRKASSLFSIGSWLLVAHAISAEETLTSAPAQAGLMKSEFIFEKAPFAQCHASTIVETKGTLIAAWFGGTGEGHSDVGIWVSRLNHGQWTAPVEVARGKQADGSPQPCWNPVLFQPKAGPLLLFYKVGPSPRKWWGMLMDSSDGGIQWSASRRLPEGILGPIKNKPVELANGDILCPSSTEHDGWRVHFERTPDLGQTWSATEPVNDGKAFSAIQPSILFHQDGRLQAVGRTRQGKIFEVWSKDNGKTWSQMTATGLPNPNSGIDAVTLKDGRQLLVYNHTTKGRSPLNVAVSADGQEWQAALVLENEPGEYSYPAVIQSGDGLVHITYTWKRLRVKHAVLDPSKLQLRPIRDGQWPVSGTGI